MDKLNDRPVLVPAVIEAAEVYDLSTAVATWTTAKGRVVLDIPDGLIRAIRASSTTELGHEELKEAVLGLLDELAERGRTTALAIWFRLAED